MRDLNITVVGNLTADPDLRFTAGGDAVVQFSVAHNVRRPDKDRPGEWIDGEPTFFRCQAWRDHAEAIATSLVKGLRVVVTGRLRTDRWEDDKGEKKERMVLDVDEVGVSVRYAKVSAQKMARRQDAPPDDEWSTASPGRLGELEPEPAF